MEELIKNLSLAPSLINALLILLKSPVGWVVILAMSAWLFLNKDFTHVFNVIERRQKRRIEHLERYLADLPNADPLLVEAFKEQRDALYFQVVTGIRAEKIRRLALVELHRKLSHAVTWADIKYGQHYIEVDAQGVTTVRERDTAGRVEFLLGLALMMVMLTLGVLLFLLFLLSPSKTMDTVLQVVPTALLCIGFFMIGRRICLPWVSANTIRSEWQKLSATPP